MGTPCLQRMEVITAAIFSLGAIIMGQDLFTAASCRAVVWACTSILEALLQVIHKRNEDEREAVESRQGDSPGLSHRDNHSFTILSCRLTLHHIIIHTGCGLLGGMIGVPDLFSLGPGLNSFAMTSDSWAQVNTNAIPRVNGL